MLRGSGKSFCSGNDLNNFSNQELWKLDPQQLVEYICHNILEDYGKAIIESEKPIFGLVHGKTIGMAFTQLALLDRIYAVEGCTFSAPFIKISQAP